MEIVDKEFTPWRARAGGARMLLEILVGLILCSRIFYLEFSLVPRSP